VYTLFIETNRDGNETMTHLETLQLRLSNERIRLERATTDQERELRKVWVSQIEKEIADEKKFLNLNDAELPEMTDAEILAELEK